MELRWDKEEVGEWEEDDDGEVKEEKGGGIRQLERLREKVNSFLSFSYELVLDFTFFLSFFFLCPVQLSLYLSLSDLIFIPPASYSVFLTLKKTHHRKRIKE